MAKGAYRDMRRTLPVVLALLLALFATGQAPQPGADHASHSATASAAAPASETPAAESSATPVIEPAAARVFYVVVDCERTLRTQLVVTVRAARAPPLQHL